MGVLTDILVATEEDARIGAERIKVDTPDRLDLQGIDIVPISVLRSIVLSLEQDEDGIDAFPLVYQESDSGPWILQFTPDFTESLLLLESTDIRRCAEAWSKTEEMEGLSPAGCAEVIGWLIDLARRADARGMQMYCWMSL